MATRRRMSREERRAQLLETAFAIIRTEGTNALTLVRLAERAGVSRPVAYEHFATREGLLLALYREYDERLGRSLRAALAEGGAGSLAAVARTLSAAYVDGTLAAGPECEEVAAALSGNRETRDFRRASRDFYVAEFGRALTPFAAIPPGAEAATLLGVLGAVDALAQEAASGRLSRAAAVSAAVAVMVGALRG